MYKVKTNQTDLPLSQLQIRSSGADHPYPRQPTRAPLPTSRSAAIHIHNNPAATSHSHPSPETQHNTEELTTIPTSSPPRPPPMSPAPSHDPAQRHPDFATPILPRSRDGYAHHSRGSPGRPDTPEVTLTSSVVKGRAADGLLSLMGSRSGPRQT
jgi:hypothetical protein